MAHERRPTLAGADRLLRFNIAPLWHTAQIPSVEPGWNGASTNMRRPRRSDAVLPWVRASAGRRSEALATLDQLRQLAEPRATAPIRTAFAHIGLGDKDRAFEWLLKAFEAHDWQMVMLKVEPAFDPLRSDPRFAALVERVGLPR
jgi:hypothetical protein